MSTPDLAGDGRAALAVGLGVQIGESAVGEIDPIHFQGAAAAGQGIDPATSPPPPQSALRPGLWLGAGQCGAAGRRGGHEDFDYVPQAGVRRPRRRRSGRSDRAGEPRALAAGPGLRPSGGRALHRLSDRGEEIDRRPRRPSRRASPPAPADASRRRSPPPANRFALDRRGVPRGAATAAPHDKVRAARAAARAWRRGGLAHVFDVAMPARPARPEAPDCCRQSHAQARQGGLGAQPDRDAARARPYRVRRDRPGVRHGRAVRRRHAAQPSSTTGSASAPTRRCISPCSTGGCARSARVTARCPRMTACGKRRPIQRTICSPGWRWCRWCSRRAGSTSRRRLVAAFERAGDARSAAILSRIYRDEIRHVAAGTRWFRIACESREFAVVAHWQRLVRAHFRGRLSRRSTTRRGAKPVCPANSMQGLPRQHMFNTVRPRVRGWHFRRQFRRAERPSYFKRSPKRDRAGPRADRGKR